MTADGFSNRELLLLFLSIQSAERILLISDQIGSIFFVLQMFAGETGKFFIMVPEDI